MKAFARAATLALLFAASTAYADIAGRVVGVIDGDTLDVLVDKRPVRVRLAQIDAPEKRQAFGTRARQALSSLAFRQDVTVIEAGPDRYGRTVGTVYVGAVNVNNELVRQGMAWAYRRYVTDPAVIQIEAEARREKRGLWVDPSPVPPWEYRHQSAAAR
ncbi:TPA: thermonuclease family protein [Pseudomonas aeruginosa]|nr:thermonuclease family protein [Pseudomonas aeruginosa]